MKPGPKLDHLEPRCPDYVREIVSARKAALAGKDLLAEICTESGFDETKVVTARTALASIMIDAMWDYIKQCPFFLQKKVKNTKNFWHNFRIYAEETLNEYQKSWKEEMERRKKQPENSWENLDRYFKTYQTVCVLSATKDGFDAYPDFTSVVSIMTRFLQVIENKYRDIHKTEIPDDIYQKAIENSPLQQQILGLMRNPRHTTNIFEDILEHPLTRRAGPNSAPEIDGRFDIDLFTFDPATCRVAINERFVEVVRRTIQEHPSLDTAQLNCPVLYSKIFQEFWEWFLKIFRHYRFGEIFEAAAIVDSEEALREHLSSSVQASVARCLR